MPMVAFETPWIGKSSSLMGEPESHREDDIDGNLFCGCRSKNGFFFPAPPNDGAGSGRAGGLKEEERRSRLHGSGRRAAGAEDKRAANIAGRREGESYWNPSLMAIERLLKDDATEEKGERARMFPWSG